MERKAFGRSALFCFIASSLRASTGMSSELALRRAKDSGGSEAERPYSGMDMRGRLAGFCTSASSIAPERLESAATGMGSILCCSNRHGVDSALQQQAWC